MSLSQTNDQSSIYYRCPYYCNGCDVQFCLMFEKYKDCEYYNYIKGKDVLPMENKTLEKTLDMAGSVAKIAANLSEVKKDPAPRPFTQTDDNSNRANNTGSQNVVVAVDRKKKEPKPVEKHIHEFPEARALTEQECELALKKAQMEYELEKSKQSHIVKMDERNWQHQMELESKNEKKRRIRNII